jgi:hypothetical protein
MHSSTLPLPAAQPYQSDAKGRVTLMEGNSTWSFTLLTTHLSGPFTDAAFWKAAANHL